MNQVFSLVLGLVVVVLLLVVLNQRYNIIGRLLPFQDVATADRTPTATPTVTTAKNPSFISRLFNRTRNNTPTPTAQVVPTTIAYRGQTQGVVATPTPTHTQTQPQQIPSAGTPTSVLVLFTALGYVGLRLRRITSRS